jgi:methionine-rich copper-binding protein CopC
MNLRRLIGFGGIAGIALAALVGVAPAQAHNAFVSSTPAAGSVVTEQPGTFVITTSDALLDSGPDSPTTFLQVRGPGAAQLYYGDGCATVDGASITMPVQLGEAGEYTVAWGVVSADGHPITSADNGGDIVFTWQPADGQELGSGFSAPPTCGEAPVASETSAPDETEAAPAAPTDTATSAPAAEIDATSDAAATILWIGIGLGVLVVAAIVGLVVVRSRTRSAERADAASGPGDPPAAL